MKVHPIPHTIFETARSGFIEILHHFSVPWEISLLYLFSRNLWFKGGAQQSAKFQTFDCSGEISPNLYFDGLLSLKVYKISAKKYRGVISHELKRGAQFKEKPIFCFKNDKTLLDFDPSSKKSKKFTLWLIPFVKSI